jgi:hypothetical protein
MIGMEKPVESPHSIDNWKRSRIFRSVAQIFKAVTMFLAEGLLRVTLSHPVGVEKNAHRGWGWYWRGLKVGFEGELILPRGVVWIGLRNGSESRVSEACAAIAISDIEVWRV